MKPYLHAVTTPTPQQLDRLSATMGNIGTAYARLAGQLRNLTLSIRWGLASPAQREVLLAGMQGRYFVRGGLHPAHSSRDGLDRLVQAILDGTADAECRLMQPAERRLCATAAMNGWIKMHDGPAPVMAWHRLMGSTSVSVGREA